MTKTAVITGAARNIGKGIAKGLLEDGYHCILLDIDAEALQKTKQELAIGAHKCDEYVIDIGDLAAIDNFMNWLKQKANSVTVLVNNVAFDDGETVLSLSPQGLKKNSAVNVDGTFYLTSRVANMMINAAMPGNIIFISSTHAKITRMHPLYSAAKAGIEMFMKEAALELASKNIRVNAVAPGIVEDTPALKQDSYMPLGVNQQPQDVAECVRFLVSDRARFITGQTITVDGGFSLTHIHFWKKQGKL